MKRLYGCNGGPKNNGLFSYINELGQLGIGNNNRPVSKADWSRRSFAGTRSLANRKFYNMHDRIYWLSTMLDK